MTLMPLNLIINTSPLFKSLFFVLPLCLLLSACSSTAPSTKAATEICTGTKRPYKINGTTYYPQDHYDYEEEGVASWYGPGFHQRPGSCGSIYNQHALTAAHKTLPIPSVVEVTNLENGRQIKLVVNDRGPYVDTRIIDLSKKAAEELGTHGKGLGKVRVRAIPSESKALATYLKQFGRWGIDPSGRPWDVIYREEIAGKHHDISTESPKERVQHIQEEVIETVIHPDKLESKMDHLTYRTGESGKSDLKKSTKDDVPFEAVLEDISREPSAATKKESGQNSAIQVAAKSTSAKKETGVYFVQVGSFVQKTNAHNLTKELTKHGRTQVVMENANFYTVQLGPFASQDQARKVTNAVLKEGHVGARIAK